VALPTIEAVLINVFPFLVYALYKSAKRGLRHEDLYSYLCSLFHLQLTKNALHIQSLVRTLLLFQLFPLLRNWYKQLNHYDFSASYKLLSADSIRFQLDDFILFPITMPGLILILLRYKNASLAHKQIASTTLSANRKLQFNSSLKILTSWPNFRFFKPVSWLRLKKLTWHYFLVLFTFIQHWKNSRYSIWFVEFSVLS